MAAWAYKATTSKADMATTASFADNYGFLCRSAYTEAGAKAPRVWMVRTGDVIHFYYVTSNRPDHAIGTFEVVDSATHPRPELFGEPTQRMHPRETARRINSAAANPAQLSAAAIS